jgi:probable rRNA maturation factor
MPSFRLLNRQRKRRIDLRKLQSFAGQALSELLASRRPAELPEDINIIFVSDARIAWLHRKYMSIKGPTDVITFHHGEVFISVETAAKQAKEFGTSFEYELELYIVHGLLHLCGFEDTSDKGRLAMQRVQKRLVAKTRTSSAAAG